MRDYSLAILGWLIILGAALLRWLYLRMAASRRLREAEPKDVSPTKPHVPILGGRYTHEWVYKPSPPYVWEPSEQWRRDMAANRRVEQWARRERDFAQVIEDIKAGRRP